MTSGDADQRPAGTSAMGPVGRWFCRVLIRLYPRQFRAEFEDNWAAFVERQRHERRYGRGPVGVARFWMDVVADALESSFRVRMEDRTRRRGRRKMTTDAWVRETKLAVRSLAKQPGFMALAVLTLGLGIGANTAIFSVIDATLLRPLPYRDPGRIVYLSDGHPDLAPSGINQSVANLVDLKAGASLLSDMAIFTYRSVNLATEERPERVQALVTSSEMLDVLGVSPRLGRDLLPEDDIAGSPKVALLTDATWRARYGADPDIVGRTVTVDAAPVEIVGVTPPSFTFRGDPELILPLQYVGANQSRGWRNFNGIGRLADGATLQSLRAELEGIFQGLVEKYPGPNKNWHTWADPVELLMVGRNGGSLLLFGAAVGLVLLIACVNVANLLIVRADSRRRDFALRCALGAERSALLTHFVAEGLVLALMGGAMGVVLAYFGIDALVALLGGSIVRAGKIEVNGVALAFGLFVSVAVGVLVGLVPLLRSRTSEMHLHLKEGGRGASMHSNRLGRFLVITEVALAVLVVSGAGLLTNSVWNLQKVKLGVKDAEQVLTFQVSLPEATYHDNATIQAFWGDLVAELDRVPGVRAAGLVNRLPLLGGDNITNTYAYGNHERAAHFVSIRSVTPEYLAAAGVPLVAGRWLDASEFADTTVRSVVINETLARQLFPGEDAVGRVIDAGWNKEGFQVVGVVGDILGGSPTRPAPPAFYYAWSADAERARSALVRTNADPMDVLPAVRQVVKRLDPQLPIFQIRTLQEIADGRISRYRSAMYLFEVFAGLALLLGAVGIYGVMSFAVTQRTRELGVRLALGASRGSVLRMVLGQSARLTGPGVIVGVAVALASARVLGGLLYEVSPLSLPTYAAVAGILAMVSAFATLRPAWRATRVDPLTSIQSE